MKKPNLESTSRDFTRREFIKTTAAASAATLMANAGTNFAYPSSSDRLRVGLIGCGGRGTGAAKNCVESSKNVQIVAMGDLFQDRLDSSRNNLESVGDKLNVTDSRCFVGWDSYEKVLNSDVDLVILATPPGFRPAHLRAAVEAGKHIFMEKPVAVDPVGIRSVIASSDMARKKGLAIVAGTQRRHQASYLEVMKRIHDGAIGEIVAAQCYWNMGGLWSKEHQPGWSDMEWQVRNWLYFTWLSGDHICEQHIHNIDVINWAMKSPPAKATGLGGRQARTAPVYGHIFDHFAIEFEYPNGVRVMSMCRQIEGTPGNVSERIVGTKGVSNPKNRIKGENPYRFKGKGRNPYVQEHADLIASIRSGELLNEGRRVAESTLTAIMGRMSAYTGQVVTWEQALNSKLDLRPEKYEFGDMPIPEVAIPGKTPLI